MFFSKDSIVVSKKFLGEIDLLIELLTPQGKIWAVAKGARKSRKRFVNLLEEFNIIKTYLRRTKKGKLPILEKADLIFLPENIRLNYKKFIFLSYVGEILTKISYLYGFQIFNFIKELIIHLENNRDEELFWLKPYFELNILKFLGWEPELFKCVKCGYKPQKIFYFSIQEGGILCYKCKNDKCEFLESEILEFLRILVKIPLNKIDFLKINSEMHLNSKRKFVQIIEDFFKFFLNFDINSLKILKGLLNEV